MQEAAAGVWWQAGQGSDTQQPQRSAGFISQLCCCACTLQVAYHVVAWLALTNHPAPWSSWAMDTLIPHLKAFHKELHKQVTRRQAVRRVQELAGA